MFRRKPPADITAAWGPSDRRQDGPLPATPAECVWWIGRLIAKAIYQSGRVEARVAEVFEDAAKVELGDVHHDVDIKAIVTRAEEAAARARLLRQHMHAAQATMAQAWTQLHRGDDGGLPGLVILTLDDVQAGWDLTVEWEWQVTGQPSERFLFPGLRRTWAGDAYSTASTVGDALAVLRSLSNRLDKRA